MITTLHIKNVGIIDDLSIDFNEGFNVLTGETGAGKTLIIGSLGILAGGRFSKEMIRKDENFSYIEANIFLPDNPISIDGNIIVSREIYSNGRNLCKVNGRLVTVNELKDIMSQIIDIHGQHDNQLILNSSEHINYIDNFIGKEIFDIKIKYEKIFKEHKAIELELKNNFGDDKEKERKLDLLNYQVKEIEDAKLKKDEEEQLEEQRKLMLNSEKIQESLNNIDVNLNENAVISISNAIRCLEKIEDFGEEYKQKLPELKNIYYDIQELARDVSCMKDEIYFNEDERNQIEERLDLINFLKRKYGNSIEEILSYKEKIEQEIFKIKNLDKHNEELKNKLKLLEKEMLQLSSEMSNLRKEYGEKLSELINKELTELEMKNARFNVKIEELNGFGVNGLDKVEFFIRTNVGEEFKPLTKIASGGEMSRIMLAIKTVLAKTDKVSIMIFDEIDTGISGKASKAVAEKLRVISETHQVICITHSASVAAKGQYNYYISKNVVNNKTCTNIKQLSEEETIEEIARMSTGEVTEVAKDYARELRKVS